MFSHRDFPAPPDDTVIWRYVDLEKMLAMLCTRQLHLTRLDKLQDPWEGAWPTAMAERLSGVQPPVVGDGFKAMLPLPRISVYVNCWHISDHESAALWDQYGKSAGFAIKSSMRALLEALTPSSGLIVGAVSYVDYSEPLPDGEFPVILRSSFLKRKSFSHEQEVRILKWLHPIPNENNELDYTTNPPGFSVDVDLERRSSACTSHR